MDKLTARIEAALKHHKKMVIAKVRSKSNPTVKHSIRLAADHSVYCTCQGWQYSKEKPKTCRHMERWKAAMRPQEL